ncbi:MAG: MFS transporter, partial [Nocardioidaceae bacterium]|nr:MFS transporter [Nocardioidaceae bacterium]
MSQPAQPPTPSANTSRPERHPRRWGILAVLCLSLVMVTLDNTVLNVAVPSLVEDLSLSTSQVQWVVDSYSLVFAGLLLIAGSAADRFGRRRGLLTGLAVFGLGSLIAARSSSVVVLVAARGVMGVGGALLMPATLAILMHVFEADERPRAIGIWGGVSALGVSAGPIVGGVLLDHFGWGSVFLVNVPVVLLALVAALAIVPESRRQDAPRPDIVGALLSSLGILAIVWSTIQVPDHGWLDVRVGLGAALAGAAGVAFVGWERRCPQPLIQVSLLRSGQFLGATTVGGLLLFSLAGTTFLLTQHLQLTLGFSPLAAGVRVLPVAVAIAVVAPLSPQLSARIGPGRAIAVGLLLLAGGLATIGLTVQREQYWPVAVGLVGLGAGLGVAMAPASAALMGSFPREHAGVGAAMNDTMQEIGAALGVAVLGSLAAASYRHGLPSDVPGAARGSYGAALSLARHEGAAGSGLAAAAHRAFDLAVEQSLVVASLVTVVGAVVAVVVLGR